MESILKYGTTGLFTDYMDNQGLPYIFLPGFNINNSTAFLLGKIRTIKCEAGPFKDENINLGLGYLDHCNPGDVLVVEGSNSFAYFGELMSRLAAKRGIQGAIIGGMTRDRRFTSNLLPVMSKGYMPVDIKGRGRVIEVGCPIALDNAIIDESMVVAADYDGVVIFSQKTLQNIIEALQTEIAHEEMLKREIDHGKTVYEILQLTRGF